MIPRQIVPHVYQVSFGMVSAFILDADELVIIDAGIPGSEKRILQALSELGRRPGAVQGLLVTHCHGDHTGGLAALQAATGAPVYIHPADAALVREGRSTRGFQPAPGLLPALLYRLAGGEDERRIQPVQVDYEINAGETLPLNGVVAIHTPGHCAGHLAYLWPEQGGVLFAGDIAANMLRLGPSPFYEDFAQGMKDLQRVAHMEFTTACFAHGKAIPNGANRHFEKKWGG